MYKIALVCLLLCAAHPVLPTVDVPVAARVHNWGGSQGGGSCVHASFKTLLYWQGRTNTAKRWQHENGETWQGMEQHMEVAGIRYAVTTSGDVKFLEWACRTRRGAAVVVRGGVHMVTLVHMDKEWVALLDNNDTSKFIWVPRAQFIAEWKNSSGWAFTPVYAPTPPKPC